MVLAAEITKEVPIPEGVTVTIMGDTVTAKGPKGEQKRKFEDSKITMKQEKDRVVLTCKFPNKQNKALIGTFAGHISNMIHGVKTGFKYNMKIYYSHFPMNVSVQGNKIIIKNFLGEKHPRETKIVGDTKVTVKGQDVTIEGVSKEDVGQTAGNLKLGTKIGRKDPRVFQDGIFLADRGDAE